MAFLRFLLLCPAFGLVLLIASQATANSLRVLTWEEYFAPELIKEFESTYNTEVEFIYYEFDDERDQIMAETNGNGFDVILVDDVELTSYANYGWLAELDHAQLNNLKYHGTTWAKLIPQASQYASPYGWGVYGIAYRSDLLASPPQNWDALFRPNQELSGFIQMPPQASELLYIASAASDISLDEPNVKELEKLFWSLVNQQQHVFAYKTLTSENSHLESGQVKAAVTYNDDALFLQGSGVDIEFTLPEGNVLAWIDYLAISARSKNFALAHAFLDFFLEPAHVTSNMEYHYTASFCEKANQNLPKDIEQNEIIFPVSSDVISLLPPPTKSTIRTQMKLFNALGLK